MARTTVIRYTTREDAAQENERLIRAVFAQLAEQAPDGVTYSAYRLDDGVGFVHVVTVEGDDNPLLTMPAFQEFQAGIGERCVDGPTPSGAAIVGSYG